jgi:hypothetical protein
MQAPLASNAGPPSATARPRAEPDGGEIVEGEWRPASAIGWAEVPKETPPPGGYTLGASARAGVGRHFSLSRPDGAILLVVLTSRSDTEGGGCALSPAALSWGQLPSSGPPRSKGGAGIGRAAGGSPARWLSLRPPHCSGRRARAAPRPLRPRAVATTPTSSAVAIPAVSAPAPCHSQADARRGPR